jgi:hypothetical protein
MANDNSVVNRLISRSGEGIRRVAMPDGGEVYTGPLAAQALRSLGARAFTMDNTIFVDEGFDVANAEDQSLYAHEVYHQINSGGDHDHHGAAHDAEEFAARAVEAMVLHRAAEGEDFGNVMRDVRGSAGGAPASAPRSSEPVAASPSAGGKGKDADPNSPEAAYAKLRSSGKTPDQIVDELAQFVLKSLRTMQDDARFRKAQAGGFF